VKAFRQFRDSIRHHAVQIFGKKCTLDAAAFFDAGRFGRLERPIRPRGTGLGLKYGNRRRLPPPSGQSLRGTRRYCLGQPDATPIRGYFTAGHIF